MVHVHTIGAPIEIGQHGRWTGYIDRTAADAANAVADKDVVDAFAGVGMDVRGAPDRSRVEADLHGLGIVHFHLAIAIARAGDRLYGERIDLQQHRFGDGDRIGFGAAIIVRYREGVFTRAQIGD